MNNNIKQLETNKFLDQLRASGKINMFGAGPYIQAEFGCNRQEAKEILIEWMATFESRLKAGEVTNG